MKKFKLLLSLMLTALLPMNAAASETAANVSIVPNPELVHNSLSEITVQYLDARYGIAPQVDVSDITLTRKGSTEVLYALSNPAIDYAKLTLKFAYKGETQAVTVTEEGIYTLHIPDGAVSTYDTMSPLGGVDVNFTINANATNEMTRYELSPATGEVTEINTIAVTFPDAGGLDWFYNDLFGNGNFSAITLTNKNDPSVKYTAVKKKFDMNNTVTLGFADADGEVTVTAPGRYELNIPADMFQKDFTTVRNGQITAEYIIGPVGAPEFEGMISSPADNGSVGRFDVLSLIFPNLPEGLEYPVNDIARATLTTPSGDIYYGFSPMIGSAEGGTYNRLLLRFAPKDAVSIEQAMVFTTEGVYKVKIPEGTLKAYGKDASNSDIDLSFTVDPMLDFSYTVSPAADVCHQTFGEIVFTCAGSIKSLSVNPECAAQPTISLGETTYTLEAKSTLDTSVTLSVPADATATPGNWTVKVPAGFFSGVNANGVTISNTTEITTTYIIKEPEHFDYTVEPADGSTIEFFKNITLEFSGQNLKAVNVNPEAGQPVMTDGEGTRYELEGNISGRYVIFTTRNGAELGNGTYTVSIPAGYVSTVDRDNLVAGVGEVTTSFVIVRKIVSDYTDGILFLNEGWFGHDTGSLNFLSNNGDWTYDVFARNNADHRLGVTSQYGQCFGDKVYVVSKQSEGDGEAAGGVFTIMDAATMKFVSQINRLPDDQSQPRAFCAWNEHKGYLSTKDRIYTVDLDNMEVSGVVPGTDVYTSFDSNGEMLRYGDRVYAVRESSGVDAIDPATGDVVKIPAELAEAFAVTPDGSLYVATRNESNEFMKISTESLCVTEVFDIDSDRSKIVSVWDTWRKAPLAVDITSNIVYYITKKASDDSMNGPRTIARYNFDTKQFDEEFITLPGVADGEEADWVLYGEGVSVDPASGYILLTAVEAGYGSHYSKNRVFVADPVTGKIMVGRTHVLEDAYWFPAMALYPDFEAPAIDANGLSLPEEGGSFTLDVAEVTTLAVGNPHLVNYKAESSDENICTVKATDKPGVFDVTVSDPESTYTITLSADYQGKISTATLTGGKSSVDTIADGQLPAVFDVYNLQGICVRRNATRDDVYDLPTGIYIIDGRKYFVR